MNLKAQHTSHTLLRLAIIGAQLTTALGLSAYLSTAATRPALAAPSQITGTVYEDFNSNGVQDTATTLTNNGSGVIGVAVDRGVSGVTATAFDATGASVGTATSDANGAYVINIATIAGPYRIEFSTLPAGYQPAFHGPNNGTSVQFVPDGNTANVNFGVTLPANYCQNNPTIYTPCAHFGASNDANSGLAGLYSFPYSAGSNGTTVADIPLYDAPPPTAGPTKGQIGTTFGLAYARGTRQLFAASYFKKHAGFGPGQDTVLNTPDDSGAIYVINPATNAILNTLTVPGTTNAHDTTNYFIGNGNIAWNAVGKTSLGGIALSPDESTLYVLNLDNRTLYALTTSTGAVTASQATPAAPPSCTAAGDVRPWAVEVYNGVGYVGIVCSGESTQQVSSLQAYVYTFNLTTLAFSPSPVLQFPLGYPRGFGSADPTFNPPVPGSVRPAAWNAWAPTFTSKPPAFGTPGGQFPVYPQPILSSIAFDAGGNMILGIRDRFGDQMGNEAPSNPANPNELYYGVSAGDTLRACGNLSVGWTLESNARCGGTGSGPQNNGQGPGNGEFYWRDEYVPFHEEVSLGTVAQVPGFPDVVNATYNPIPVNGTPETTFDGGVRWFNNTSGGFGKGYRVYNGSLAGGNLFGKAGGLGDLAILCDAAPIELGNRVWLDGNANGRQDPGPAEAGLANVTVGLYDAGGALLVSTVTAADGTYYFTATNAAGTALIQPGTGYQIRIDNTQAVLAGFALTTQNSVAGGNGVPDTSNNSITDVRDSDAAVSGNFAQIVYTTGPAGYTNHSFDFGYVADVYDWGDNPDTAVGTGPGNYRTLLNDDGPRHKIVAGLLMGALIDAETNGQPNAAANGDDINPPTADDEDGVTVSNLTLQVGVTATVRVTATNITAQPAQLCGFIDFNGDGDFADAGESATLPVPTGSNSTPFALNFGTVPASAVAATYSRFRLGPAGACVESGISTAGEVEDYPVSIRPAALAALGDYVWVDQNRNGIQDEPPSDGRNGVLVTLYQNGVPISTTTTANKDSNPGYYLFDFLQPGTYSVTFQLPPGFTFTQPNQGGDDSKDSDADPVTGATGNYTLAAGERNLTVDAGLLTPAPETAGLGDFVWQDNNRNGLQDPGEPGVPGITVTLYNQAGTALSTTFTNASGYYSFTNLTPGVPYQVGFALPPGYIFTIQNAGSNDQIDSDADPVTGRTQFVTLAPGEFNPTIDAGIIPPLARLGDYVWHDLNKNGIQEPGEPGIPGVTVTLLTPGGTVLSTTLTDGGGIYHFDDLNPGSYQVCWALPPGFVFSPPNQGGDDAKDSDADPVTGCAPVVTLAPGESNQTIDAGMYQEAVAPQLVIRKSSVPATGTIVKLNDLITYTLTVTNTGSAPANNVRVSDRVPTNTQYIDGSATPALESGPDPVVWNLGTLTPGQSKAASFTVRVTSGGEVRNLASVRSDETPPTPSNEVLNPRSSTAVTLAAFNATVADKGVKVMWRTSIENNTFGFYLMRSVTDKLADAVKVSENLVVAKGASTYELVDEKGSVNNRYWLQEVEVSGNLLMYGPVAAQAPAGLSPITSPQPQPNPQPSVLATSAVGGVPVSQAAANVVSNTVSAAGAAAAQAGAAGPQVLAAQPAVIAPAVEAKPAAQTQAQPSGPTQPQAAPATDAAQATTGTEANASPSQPRPLSVVANQPDASAVANVAEAEAVGATGAVAVARGGQPGEPRVTGSTQGVQSSKPASAVPWLFGAGVLTLALAGAGTGAAFVIRRRRAQAE